MNVETPVQSEETLSRDHSAANGPAARRLDWKFEEAGRIAALDEPGRALYRALVCLRVRLSQAEGVPAYRVFTDRQLLLLCERRPTGWPDLVRIPGFGPRRLAAFGEDVVAVVRAILGPSQGPAATRES